MRRRRKKYTWMPVIPTALGPEIPGASWYDGSAVVNITDPGQIYSAAFNIVPDDTINADEVVQETTLRDAVEGQEYVVERVVGRVWGAVSQQDEPETWLRCLIGIGIAVMPYEDNDTLALNDASIDPLGASNSDGSWMYRSIWPIFNNSNPEAILGPTNIANCGPDYGFVDTRSVRRVHRNERLTIVFSFHCMDLVTPGAAATINFGYDLRVLGAMRKAQGQSTYT